MFWIASRGRAKLPIPKWVLPVVAAGALVSVGVKFTYGDQIRRFWNEIRNDWRVHELMLGQDSAKRIRLANRLATDRIPLPLGGLSYLPY